jgi:hypothetical protein
MEASQSILEKIKKLKSLSEGALKINSVAESEAATIAMNQLLTKYNLSLLDIEDAQSGTSSIRIERSQPLSVQNPYGRLWKERLLMTLCRYNYCQLLGSSYNVFLLGSEINMMTVIDLFNTLQSVYLHNGKISYEQIKHNLVGGQRTKKYMRKYITSYLLGCSIGLDVKLNKIQSQECTSIAICHKGMIDKYISDNLKLKSKPAKEVKTNDSAYNKGFYKGMATELQKTIIRPF